MIQEAVFGRCSRGASPGAAGSGRARWSRQCPQRTIPADEASRRWLTAFACGPRPTRRPRPCASQRPSRAWPSSLRSRRFSRFPPVAGAPSCAPPSPWRWATGPLWLAENVPFATGASLLAPGALALFAVRWLELRRRTAIALGSDSPAARCRRRSRCCPCRRDPVHLTGRSAAVDRLDPGRRGRWVPCPAGRNRASPRPSPARGGPRARRGAGS
jgi:hypothetical protein